MILPRVKAVMQKTADYVRQHGNAILGFLQVSSIQFLGGTGTQGTVTWDSTEETLDLVQNGNVLQIGQELQYQVKNQTGVTIPKGTVVMAVGALGASGRILIAPMDGTIPENHSFLLGIVTYDILNGADGKVACFGKIRGLDTSAFAAGDVLYVSTTVLGQLQNTVPTTGLRMPVAFVINSHATQGTLMVRVTPLNENEWEASLTAASKLEMETGTETALRSMSPLRVAQAIAALAPTAGNTIFALNVQTVSTNYTVPSSYNASAVGPIDVAPGILLDIAPGSSLLIL